MAAQKPKNRLKRFKFRTPFFYLVTLVLLLLISVATFLYFNKSAPIDIFVTEADWEGPVTYDGFNPTATEDILMGNKGIYRQVLINNQFIKVRDIPVFSDGSVNYGCVNNGTCEWSSPIPVLQYFIIPNADCSNVKAYSATLLPENSNKILESVWCLQSGQAGYKNYHRVSDLVNMGNTVGYSGGTWRQVMTLSDIPGTYGVTAESIFPFTKNNNKYYMQAIWTGQQGYYRVLPYTNYSSINWKASQFSTVINASNFPGSGNLNALNITKMPDNTVLESFVRGTQGFYRYNGSYNYPSPIKWEEVSVVSPTNLVPVETNKKVPYNVRVKKSTTFSNFKGIEVSVYKSGSNTAEATNTLLLGTSLEEKLIGTTRYYVPKTSHADYNLVLTDTGTYVIKVKVLYTDRSFKSPDLASQNFSATEGTPVPDPTITPTPPVGGLPGSGPVQAISNFKYQNYLHQTVWQSNRAYSRTIPITNGEPNYNCSSTSCAWSSGRGLDFGSGDIMAYDLFPTSSNSGMQVVYRGSQAYSRDFTVGISNNRITFTTPNNWSSPVNINTLPGNGNVKAVSHYKHKDGFLVQTIWRNEGGYYRKVPLNSNGSPNWSQAFAWSDPFPYSGLQGSGELQAESKTDFGSGKLLFAYWRGDTPYTQVINHPNIPDPVAGCVPALQFPANGSEIGIAQVTWSECPSPSKYMISYRSTSSNAQTSPVVSDLSYLISGLSYNTTYYWKVRSCASSSTANNCINPSNYSSEWNFKYVQSIGGIPCVPNLVSPADGFSQETGQISFNWQSCGENRNYEVLLDKVNDNSDGSGTSLGIFSQTSASRTINTEGSYRWSVRSCNNTSTSSCSNPSNYAAFRNFTIQNETPPPASLNPVGLLAPSNNYNLDKTTTSSLGFRWSDTLNSTDNLGDFYYKLQISNTTVTSDVYTLNIPGDNSVSGSIVINTSNSENSDLWNFLQADNTYSWKVSTCLGTPSNSCSNEVVNTGGSRTLVVSDSTTPPPPSGDNLIRNGDYSQGQEYWNFTSNGSANFQVQNQEAIVGIDNAGSNTQLYQFGFNLEKDTVYTLSFDAKSNRNRSIGVLIHKHTSPYTNYGLNESANLSNNVQNFSYVFRSSGFSENLSPSARLRFWFVGDTQNGDEITIDNVSLVKGGDIPVEPEICTPDSLTSQVLPNNEGGYIEFAWACDSTDTNFKVNIYSDNSMLSLVSSFTTSETAYTLTDVSSLEIGSTYYWYVGSCEDSTCSNIVKTSPTQEFTYNPGVPSLSNPIISPDVTYLLPGEEVVISKGLESEENGAIKYCFGDACSPNVDYTDPIIFEYTSGTHEYIIRAMVEATSLDFANSGVTSQAYKLLGDVNEDGMYTINDALNIVTYIFGSGEQTNTEIMDVNRDNKVTIIDMVRLLQFIFK